MPDVELIATDLATFRTVLETAGVTVHMGTAPDDATGAFVTVRQANYRRDGIALATEGYGRVAPRVQVMCHGDGPDQANWLVGQVIAAGWDSATVGLDDVQPMITDDTTPVTRYSVPVYFIAP